MPSKGVKDKNRSDEDGIVTLKSGVRVELLCSTNAPSWLRMGHVSYIHPKNGLLCVMGGCDATTLSHLSCFLHQDEPLERVPFVEWWNISTRMWGVDIDDTLLCLNEVSMDALQRIEATETGSFGGSTAASQEHLADFSPAQVPSGFSWPTLAAIVVDWKPAGVMEGKLSLSPAVGTAISLSSNETLATQKGAEGDEALKGAKANGTHKLGEAVIPPLREHPVVLLIGGWNGIRRLSRAAGFDMNSGVALHVRGETSSGLGPLTCSTVNVVQGRAYVFGGNNNKGCSSAMEVLDLSTYRWCKRAIEGKEEVITAFPSPRSSHVAGVLLGRYIVIYGGRRLESLRVATQSKGKKALKKVDPKAVQPIRQPGVEFCNDVAVYDVERECWVATSIGVGSHGPPPRYGHAACVIGPNELLVHGGIGVGGKLLSDAWVLWMQKRDDSTVSIVWVNLVLSGAELGPLPARGYHSLAMGTGAERRVYMTGGICASGGVRDVCVMDVSPVSDVVTHSEGRRRAPVRK